MLWMIDRAMATNHTFTAGSSNEWTTPGNWTPSGVPVSGDSAVVPATSTGTMTITGSSISIGNLVDSSINPQVLANGGSDATNVTLTLTGNGTAPLVTLNSGSLATQPNLTIQGANGSTGTGTLGLVLGASGDFNLVNGPELIVSANLSETGGSRSINKNGIGTLVFSGTNSFSGAMGLTQGSAVWTYSQSAGDKIASTGSLQFNGGSLELDGNGTTTVNQTVASLNVVSGKDTLTLVPTSQSLNLNVGPVVRTNNGGLINFVLAAGSGGAATVTTTSTNGAYGIVGGWATVGTTDWATVDASNHIVALPTASYTDTNNPAAWTTGQNITNTTSGAYSGTVASSVTIGSLKFNNSTSTVTVGPSATLTIGSGGVMNTQVNGIPMTVNGGNLTSGSQDLIFNNTNGGNFAISSTITDNAVGSVGLTKTGTGSLTMTGNNTFSGHVIINGGSLAINSLAALGTGASYGTITVGTNGTTIGSFGGSPLASGTLDFQFNNGVLTRAIDLGSAGGAIRNANGTGAPMLTLAGPISGGALLRYGTTATTLISGTNNTYTGATEIEAGSLEVAALASLGSPSSIGTGSTDATLAMGSGANVGTLTYDGSTDANTGRNLLLYGTSGTGNSVRIVNANTVGFNSISSAPLNVTAFNKYGPGTIEITGSGATFVTKLIIQAGGYQFDDPTGVGIATSNITVGSTAVAAGLIYGGNTPVTISRTLDTGATNVPSSTIGSNISVMTLTGGFTSSATAAQGLIFTGNGGVIMNSSIGGAVGLVTKQGNGTAEFLSNNSYTNTLINGGTLILGNSSSLGSGTINLQAGGALALANGFTSAVTIHSPDNTPFNNNGLIDVNQGKFVVEYTTNDRFSQLKAQVVAGSHNGAWNVSGNVVTSAAARASASTSHPMGVAIAEGSSIMGANYGASSGSIGGQPVDTTSVVLVTTYDGDTTMNGTVDSNDFDILASNFGKVSSTLNWTDGDYNYDGIVNTLDFNGLAQNFGQPQLPAALPDAALPTAALGTVVPEPTSIALLSGIAALAARRRKRA